MELSQQQRWHRVACLCVRIVDTLLFDRKTMAPVFYYIKLEL